MTVASFMARPVRYAAVPPCPAPRRRSGLAVAAALAACWCAGPVLGQTAGGAAILDAADRGLRVDIEWLADRRVISLPLTTWPLPADTLRAALASVRPERLADAERDAFERVQAGLRRLDAPLTASAGVNSARHVALDGENTPRARAEGAVALQAQREHVAGRLRLRTDDEPLARQVSRADLDGSYVAGAWGGVSISAGLLDRWWGPGRFTSPLLSDAAPPIPTVTLRRASDARPGWWLLDWVGPWGYEVSFGRLRDYTPRHTRTFGLRLYARPLEGLELGASRFITWAGEGQPGGAGAFWDAFTGDSNPPTGSSQLDPSNEIAGFDARYSYPNAFGGAYVVYAQILGEDEKNHLPFKRFGTVGLQFKHALGADRHEWTLEATDTQTGRLFGLDDPIDSAYIHSTYVDGHYNRGLPIGAHIGGGGRSVSFGWSWSPRAGGWFDRLSIVATQADVSQSFRQRINGSFGEPGRVRSVQTRLDGGWRALRWHAGLSWQDYSADVRRDVGVIAGVEVPIPFAD